MTSRKLPPSIAGLIKCMKGGHEITRERFVSGQSWNSRTTTTRFGREYRVNGYTVSSVAVEKRCAHADLFAGDRAERLSELGESCYIDIDDVAHFTDEAKAEAKAKDNRRIRLSATRERNYRIRTLPHNWMNCETKEIFQTRTIEDSDYFRKHWPHGATLQLPSGERDDVMAVFVRPSEAVPA